MTPNGSLKLFASTCRIRVPSKVHMPDNPEGACGWIVRNEPLSIPIIGQMPEVRALKLAEAMQRHIRQAHPEISKAIEQGSLKYSALLAGQMFNLDDPHAQQMMRLLRVECLQPIPRPFISDEAIRNTVDSVLALKLTPDELRDKWIAVIADARSILTETRPAPQPEPAPV